MSEAREGTDRADAASPSLALKITPVAFFAIAGALLLAFVDPYRYHEPLNAPTRLLALFLIAIPCLPALRWLDEYATERRTATSDLMICAGCGLAIGLFVHATGTFHLGGADHSTLIDAGWRLLNGQDLYRSFQGPLPPSFALGSELAYRLGGVSWQSLVDYESFCSGGIAMACYALFRTAGVSPAYSAFASLAHVFATHGQCCYPWYNPMAVSASTLTLLAFLALLRTPRKMLVASALAAAIALALLSKPNGLPLALGVIPLTILAPRHSVGGVFVGLLAAAIVLFVLQIGHIDLEAMMRAYGGVAASRGNMLSRKAFHDLGYSEQLITYCMAATLSGCVVWHALEECRRSPSRMTLCRVAAMLLAAAVGGVYMQTNMELKTNDLALMFVAAAAGLAPSSKAGGSCDGPTGRSRPTREGFRVTATILLGCVLLVGGAVAGWQRVRVYAIGDQMFFQRGPIVRLTSPPFFAGMNASPRLASIVDEVRFVLDNIPATSWFFGPRMQFCYAAFGKDSPTGLPIAWDAGTMYPVTEIPGIMARWRERRPEVLIFLRNPIPPELLRGRPEIRPATLAFLSTDTTYMPPELIEDISREYVLLELPGARNITVLIRNDLAARLRARSAQP